MANLTTVPKQISPLAGSKVITAILGASATVGDVVYVASDGDVEPTDASAAATVDAVGMIVGIEGSVPYSTALSAGERVTICISGPVSGFSGLTPGARGWVSDDAGKIEDAAGTVTYPFGMALSATVFNVNPGITAPTSA